MIFLSRFIKRKNVFRYFCQGIPSKRVEVTGNLIKLERNELFDELNLSTFTTKEIDESYAKYLSQTQVVEEDDESKNNQTDKSLVNREWNHEIAEGIIENILKKRSSNSSNVQHEKEQLITQLMNELQFNEHKLLTKEIYHQNILKMATKFDYSRIFPIALSFMLTGLSIGIIVPCMPLLVQQIHLTPTEFGVVISSFAFSKLLGNIPSTYFVNTIGRKPLITYGLGVTAFSIAGYGTCLFPGYGFPVILACRLLTGLGVSGITTGGQMYLSDISTALNRVQTMNPVMMSFQAGMSLGPAIGGIFIDSFGIGPTYYTVGGMIFSVALLNHFMLTETKRITPVHISSPSPSPSSSSSSSQPIPSHSLRNSFQEAFQSWRKLIKASPIIRETLVLNGIYWIVLSGTQFSMLPLIMISPVLQMTVGQIGVTYATMSLFSVAVSQPLAYFADRYNKKHIMLTGCLLVSSSAAILPFVTDNTELIAVLMPLALGSAMMHNIPAAQLLNTCSPDDKSQALSLLRTIGDLGFIVGGTLSGILAACTSIETVLAFESSLLLTTIAILSNSHRFKLFQ